MSNTWCPDTVTFALPHFTKPANCWAIGTGSPFSVTVSFPMRYVLAPSSSSMSGPEVGIWRMPPWQPSSKSYVTCSTTSIEPSGFNVASVLVSFQSQLNACAGGVNTAPTPTTIAMARRMRRTFTT